jgi:hypothetical protein
MVRLVPLVTGLRVSERAKLCLRAAMGTAAAVLLTAACAPEPPVHGVYDERTRALLRLDYDSNGDGRIDVRTYLAGTRPYRTEVDGDGDGRVDRWEYLDVNARVVTVGVSSRGDAIEDRWTWPAAANGERRVDIARLRDRAIDRREFYRDDRLVRAEEDNNADGLADKWEVFDNGVLREVRFDTGYAGGQPDRRLLYDAGGKFVRLEIDPERDGTFAPAR